MINYYYEDNKVCAYFDLYKHSKYVNEHDKQALEEIRKTNLGPNDKPLANDLYRGWEYKLFNDTCNVMKHLFINDEDIDIVITKVLRHRRNFYGIAKCNPDDEYNLEIGKEIAKARLLAKYYRVKRRLFDELFRILCNSAVRDAQHIIKGIQRADKEIFKEETKIFDVLHK